MKKYLIITSILLLITPFVTHAALFNNLTDLINIFINLINQSIVVVLSLALLFFFWGLANFILYASDETKRKEGKNIMLWGIIALFVMLSVWGLVRVLENTFLKNSSSNITAPNSGQFVGPPSPFVGPQLPQGSSESANIPAYLHEPVENSPFLDVTSELYDRRYNPEKALLDKYDLQPTR